MASGTATLETALFKIPQVVVYKGHPVSISIARLLVKTKFISLVNLIMDRKIIKEFIQEDCNSENIIAELDNLLANKNYRQRMLNDYEGLNEKMGTPGASHKTAALIIKYTSKK